MASGNRLGEYLRARRELVQPEDVGLPAGGRRRVHGLRREELALLAGISSDYYMRLEQGRDQNPSAQVLGSLARVLGLTADATAHLHQLAQPARGQGMARKADEISPSLLQLMNSWTTVAAYVQDSLWNILASNALAVALSPVYAAGSNPLRAVFLDPDQREFRREWEQLTADGVAGLRSLAGPNVDDPGLLELVDELSAGSKRFRELWNRHDIITRRGGILRVNHPAVGPLDLNSEKLEISGSEGLTLVIFHATPHTPSAQALTQLAASTRALGTPAD